MTGEHKEEKIRQVVNAYTKSVSKILSENRENLRQMLRDFLWEGALNAQIPECVHYKNTLAIIEKFVTAYELAAKGIDVEEKLAQKTHQKVKSTLGIDTSLEWDKLRSDIEANVERLGQEDLVKYLIKKYGVLGTGEILAQNPISDKGLENEVKWILYVAAVVLNRNMLQRGFA